MTTTAGLRSRKRDNESIHTAAEPSDKDLPNVKNIQQSTAGSRFVIFLLCLFVRLCCAWLTRTYDNPDEYWQAQEVAHRMVFGYPFFLLCPCTKNTLSQPLMIIKCLDWVSYILTGILPGSGLSGFEALRIQPFLQPYTAS